MKFMITIAALLFAVQSHGATKAFDVKAEVSINGKLISSPHLVAKPGELASVTQKSEGQEILIQVTASDYKSENPRDGIMMKFSVSRVEAGQTTLISKPQIVALPGEAAVIEQGKTDKSESVKVKVIATRI